MKERLTLTTGKLVSVVAQDKELGDAEGFVRTRSDEETKALIGAAGNTYTVEKVAQYMPTPSLEIGEKKIFTIISAEDSGKYIGDVRIVLNKEVNAYELGIAILEEERSKGYGTEVLNLMSQYVFNHLSANKVILRVYQNNPRARRLYERLGYVVFQTTDDGYEVNGVKYLEDWMVLEKN